MFDPVTLLLVWGAFQVGSKRAERRAAAKGGGNYGNTPSASAGAGSIPSAGQPPHFTPQQRAILVEEATAKGPAQFTAQAEVILARRFATHTLEPVRLPDDDQGLTTFRLAPLKPGAIPAAQLIADAVAAGQVAYCSISCCLLKYDRIVALNAKHMPYFISTSPHFALYAEPKAEPKVEPKVEPKAETKAEPKAEVSTPAPQRKLVPQSNPALEARKVVLEVDSQRNGIAVHHASSPSSEPPPDEEALG